MLEANSLEKASLCLAVQDVVRKAMRSEEWTIILCPNPEVTRTACQALSCVLPPGVPFSGRTARFLKGKVSVACVDDDVFVPVREPYSVICLGWKSTDSSDGIVKWQKRN